MAFDDLRSFLQALDEQGQLLKISEEVNAEPDLAAAANATGRIGDGAPARRRCGSTISVASRMRAWR